MGSLRTRLLAYGALVAACGLAVLLAVLTRGAGEEILEFQSTLVAPERTGPIAEELTRRLGREPLATALLALAREHQRELLVLDAGGALVARAPAAGAPVAALRRADGAVQLTRGGGPGEPREVLLLMAPDVPVRGPQGQRIGSLLALPRRPEAPLAARGAGLRRALTGWLAVAVVAALAVVVPLGLVLARRTARPVEAVTKAASRLATGHHHERVPEVGARETVELARAMNALARSLEQGEELRRRMVADIAHELRTPLNRLQGQLEALEDGLLAPAAATFAHLHADVALLARLVGDLQDLALADAGRLEVHPAPCDVAAVFARLVGAHGPGAERAGLRLVVRDPGGLIAHADPDRLVQILGNLIANAEAATPRGGTITLRAEAAADGLWLSVGDTGPGFGEGDRERLFERFWRADPARMRAGRGGAGLGLAIVCALVEAHRGRVEAKNPAGGGAELRFFLPALVEPAALAGS